MFVFILQKGTMNPLVLILVVVLIMVLLGGGYRYRSGHNVLAGAAASAG